MKEYQLIIQADTNDGDYITRIEVITEDKLEDLKLMAYSIEEVGKSRNWNTTEFRRSDHLPPRKMYSHIDKVIFEWFEELVPYGEHGVHRISSITYQEISNTVHLL